MYCIYSINIYYVILINNSLFVACPSIEHMSTTSLYPTLGEHVVLSCNTSNPDTWWSTQDNQHVVNTLLYICYHITYMYVFS